MPLKWDRHYDASHIVRFESAPFRQAGFLPMLFACPLQPCKTLTLEMQLCPRQVDALLTQSQQH